MASIASIPLGHSATGSTHSSRASSVRSRSRASGSSSATKGPAFSVHATWNARGAGGGRRAVERDRVAPRALFAPSGELERARAARTITSQPIAGVGEADAAAQLGARAGRQPDAIVARLPSTAGRRRAAQESGPGLRPASATRRRA